MANGDFVSEEELARQRIAEMMDHMAWAKPYVDAALVDIDKGDMVTLENHEAQNDSRLAAMT